MKWLAGCFLLLLFFVTLCGATERGDERIPDIAKVQRHLKLVFSAIRPDLKGRGFTLEGVGGSLDDTTRRWIVIWGEFRGSADGRGKRVYFRIIYRLTAGRLTDVRLSEGVMRGRRKLVEEDPVFYRDLALPPFVFSPREH